MSKIKLYDSHVQKDPVTKCREKIFYHILFLFLILGRFITPKLRTQKGVIFAKVVCCPRL